METVKFFQLARYDAHKYELSSLIEKNGYEYVPGATSKDVRRLYHLDDMRPEAQRSEPLVLEEPFALENGITLPLGTAVCVLQLGHAPENGEKVLYAKPTKSAMAQGTESDKPKNERSAQVRVCGFSWWNFQQPV
jgi:hypothetical protein